MGNNANRWPDLQSPIISYNTDCCLVLQTSVCYLIMMKAKRRKSQILQPLNEIFGTGANVRLLRVLALEDGSFAAGELAKRALLGRTAIYPALGELERVGVIELIGAGSQRLVQLRSRHPLSRSIRALFRDEAHRFEAFIVALRDLIAGLPSQPISAWIDDMTPSTQNADTVSLFVVVQPAELETVTDALNAGLLDVERKYDIPVEVRGLTRSEVETVESVQAVSRGTWVLVGGVPPTSLLAHSRPKESASALTSHDDHDARSRKLALAIAAKIRRDPGLIAVAEDRLRRRVSRAGLSERRELAEWLRILATMSPARLRRFLLEGSERAVRLRQTLPALNLLSPAERDAVVGSRTDADVLAVVKR